MTWISSLRSRTLNGVLAAALTLPMGAPSVYAFGAWKHLRPKPSTKVESALQQLESEVSGGSADSAGSNPNVPPGSPAQLPEWTGAVRDLNQKFSIPGAGAVHVSVVAADPAAERSQARSVEVSFTQAMLDHQEPGTSPLVTVSTTPQASRADLRLAIERSPVIPTELHTALLTVATGQSAPAAETVAVRPALTPEQAVSKGLALGDTGVTLTAPTTVAQAATEGFPPVEGQGQAEDQAFIYVADRVTPETAAWAIPSSVRQPLYAQAHRAMAKSFGERRAFTLWGPSVEDAVRAEMEAYLGKAMPEKDLIELQVEAYFKRYEERHRKPLYLQNAKGAWLTKQDSKKALVDRLKALRQALQEKVVGAIASVEYPEAVDRSDIQAALLKDTRFVVNLDDETMEPAVATAEVIGTPTHQALLAFAGTWNYRTDEATRAEPDRVMRSVYDNLSGLERLLQSDEGIRALALKFIHEHRDLVRGFHVDEQPAVTAFINQQHQRVFEAYRQERLASVEQARAAEIKKTVVEIASLRLGRHITATGIPPESVGVVRGRLAQAKEQGRLVDYRVQAAGDDLVVQINHHQGTASPAIARLLVEAGTEALMAAEAIGVLKPESRPVLTAGYREREQALGIRMERLPMTERGAEPTLVVKAIHGGVGTFNRPIWNTFFNPDTHPSARIAGDSFVAVVERIDEVRQGKKDRTRYVFSGDHDLRKLLALIGDHSEWVITEVYAEAGRFSQTNPGELVAKVIFEPTDAEGYTNEPANPVLVMRVQSGSEALGVMTEHLANPWIAPGGANDAYHLVTQSVSWEQANRDPIRGYINLVAWEYMSYGDGRIPAGPNDKDVIDPFNPVAKPDYGLVAQLWGKRAPPLQINFEMAHERGRKIANFLLEHDDMDPLLTARGAEALAEQTANAEVITQNTLWIPIPDTGAGESDWMVEKLNKASKGRTFSIIKADAGGEGGHLVPPAYFSAAAEASLVLMKQYGLIASGAHFAVGDDNETISVHTRGMDDHDIHAQFYRIFWRMAYLADYYDLVNRPDGKKTVKAQTYAQTQDLVSEAARGKPIPQLAGVNDEVVALMATLLRQVGRETQAQALELGYQIYKTDLQGEVQVAVTPFGGNIAGQGPGYAEFALPAEGPVRLAAFFTDKDGPASFNRPIVWGLEQALKRGLIHNFGGAVAIIDDTQGHRRLYLDVETQMDLIRGLAANPDRYNFKWVVTKAKAGWDAANWKEHVGDRMLISTSTEKLSIITGGEYRGKDDSVMIAQEDFGKLFFEFDARYHYFTQGDGFGSHNTTVRTERLPTAIATMHSRAVKCAFWIDITADNQIRISAENEIYTDPAFTGARRDSEEMVRQIWQTQGVAFTPVGVGWKRVERSYPLAKMIQEITGLSWEALGDELRAAATAVTSPDSDYAVPAHVDIGEAMRQGQYAQQFSAISHQTSPKVARAAHDLAAPKTILIHPSFFAQGPDGAIAIQRTLNELGFANAEEAVRESAVTLILYAESGTDVSKLIEAVNTASNGAVRLKPEWFTVVTSVPTEQLAAAIGPTEWLKTIPEGTIKTTLDAPAEGKTVSSASAFYATVEAVASGNRKLPPEVQQKLKVAGDEGLFAVPETEVDADVERDLRAYQDTVSEATGNL